MSDSENNDEPKKPNFWDSLPGLILLVCAILLARTYILEPYKIPSGSMEPTLVGHEDFGDRIVTNKLAFAPANQVYMVIGGSLAIIALCFVASKAWQRKKAIVFWAIMLLAIPGGLFFALTKEAVASEPKRFDVSVFSYNEAWSGGKNQKINYIKRLWALPGEEIRISGGDVFLKKRGDYEIIRKPDELQEALWFPVARAWPDYVSPELSDADKAKLRFPWDGAEVGRPGVKVEKDRLQLDGTAPVSLSYAHQVSNVYLKQGRWGFTHFNCPAVKNQAENTDENGITWRNPKALTEDITAYIGHTSHGVVCPHCKALQFPISPLPAPGQPVFRERRTDTNYYYGGDKIAGDLRLELTLDVATGGSITLEVGSNYNSAVWNIGGTTPSAKEGQHVVKAKEPALTPGKHKLSLAYYDGIVLAKLDGKEIERQKLGIQPLGAKYNSMASFVRVSFEGVKGTLTQLDLFRDLIYTSPPEGSISSHDGAFRGLEKADGSNDFWARLQPDSYLMLGDNSPGSADGRNWGFVPRSEMMGRAGVVWWPPSRWQVIKSAPSSSCKEPNE